VTDRPAPDRIKAYLDDLGKLSARHGIWVENDTRGTLLHVSDGHAAGYIARPIPGRDGAYEIDCYALGASQYGDGVIVGDDHSPAGKEDRARRWRDEAADAITERSQWRVSVCGMG